MDIIPKLIDHIDKISNNRKCGYCKQNMSLINDIDEKNDILLMYKSVDKTYKFELLESEIKDLIECFDSKHENKKINYVINTIRKYSITTIKCNDCNKKIVYFKYKCCVYNCNHYIYDKKCYKQKNIKCLYHDENTKIQLSALISFFNSLQSSHPSFSPSPSHPPHPTLSHPSHPTLSHPPHPSPSYPILPSNNSEFEFNLNLLNNSQIRNRKNSDSDESYQSSVKSKIKIINYKLVK